MCYQDPQQLLFLGNQGCKWKKDKYLTTIVRLGFLDKVVIEKQLLGDIFISISTEQHWVNTFCGTQRDSNGTVIFIYWSFQELPPMFKYPATGLLPSRCPLLPLLPFLSRPPQIITSPLELPISAQAIELHGAAHELELLFFPENELLVEEWFQRLFQTLNIFLDSESGRLEHFGSGDFVGCSRAWASDKVQMSSRPGRLHMILVHWGSVEAGERFRNPHVPNTHPGGHIQELDPDSYERRFLKALRPLLDRGVQRENVRINLSA